MRRNSVTSAFRLKSGPNIVFMTTISYKATKFVAIRQHYKRVFGILPLSMRRNGYLGTSFHSLWRLECPIRQMHFHYRMTFTAYIRCFCATTSHDLMTLIFCLLTLTVFRVQCYPHNFFTILRLSVTELLVMTIWSHFRYL